MAKSRKQENLDNTQERSIATFQTTVDNFSKVAEKLADSFAGFAKTQELDRKAKQKQTRENKTESGGKKKVTEAMNSANDLFGRKTMSVAGKLMGRANFDGFKKGLAGMKGGGTGGMLGKAAAGLGSAGGMILKAAGPIGGIISGLKMAFDFWDSGGLAKLVAGVKMATGKAGSMLGPGAVGDMQKSLEGTEAMRKIDAKYAYTKPLELQQQLTQDTFNLKKSFAQDTLAFEQSLVKDEVDYEIGLRKDALQFQLDQQKEALDAELEKRKAISASGISFIEKYATISERALKAIGSGTKQVLEGVGKFTATFGLGIKQSFQLSENAQGLAYHLGGSDEDVMNMTKLFQTMGNTSAEMAQNLIAGFTEFAKINDIAPQVIFNQIKEAGEDIYKFSNGTADSFAKQAVLLSKMSVSMASMMKASDTMVLNYKDSIKAEMSLSSMLGKNVNLSEVRAKLMAGDQPGGAAALKSALGGIDIGAMNPFAKQQLTQATGMDISALMALMEGKEDPKVAGELKAEAAKGKAFADAALAQDIANQAAKLKLEQEQRKKLLEFEQRQRLSMMILENAQKMENIQLEAQQRAYWELHYAKDMEEKMLAGQTLEEVGSGFLASSNAKMAAGGLTQAFEAYGLDANMGAVNATRDAIVKLQEEKLINGAELKEFTTSLFDGLEGVNLKDPKAVEAAFAKAGEGVFGEKVAARNAKANEKIERIIKIAENAAGSTTGTGTTKFQTEIGATKDEIEAALKLVKETSSTLRATSMGYETDKTFGLDAKKIEALKQANTLGFKSLTASTDENTAQTLALSTEVANNGVSDLASQNELKLATDAAAAAATNGYSQMFAQAITQEELDTKLKENGALQLTEAEFGSALQIETVSLLGLATQVLVQIAINTQGLFDGEINMNGKELSKGLREDARRSYALAGAGRKTIGDYL
jgi:hypothetical protein